MVHKIVTDSSIENFIENMRQWMIDNPLDLPSQYDSTICKSEAIKRNAEIVECDKCGVKGNRPNMMRWHFENCQVVFRSCKQCGNIIPRQGVKDSLYNTKIYCCQDCYMSSKKGKAPITMTNDVKKKISDSAKSRSKELAHRMKNTIQKMPKIKCSVCNKTMIKSSFVRWKHGDECGK